MCLGIPGQVMGLSDEQPDLASVAIQGVERAINIGLLEAGEVSVGDWVLVHMGFAMEPIEAEEAREAIAFMQADQAYIDELLDGRARSPNAP